jgi:hypothetical protein
MTGNKTTTVEMLTAEVRVLMVGSRQITLSVARQLDTVNADEIEPFGRVRVLQKPDRNDVEVIGSADGVLAYAVARAKLKGCAMLGYTSGRCDLHRKALTAVGLDPDGYFRDGAYISPDEHEKIETLRPMQWKTHDWPCYLPSQEIWASWKALPLIVLAGLR